MSGKKEAERKFLIEVLGVSKTLPALWRIKSDDYSNRDKKAAAYDILLQKYRQHFTSASLEDLKKRLNNLRTNFRNELRKIDKSAKSGAGTEDLYESHAWFMEAMMFLRDQETPAQSRSTLSNTDDCDKGDSTEAIQDGDDSGDGTKDRERDNSEGSCSAITRPQLRPTKPSSSCQSVSLSRKRKPFPESEKTELLSLAKARLTEPEDHYLSQAKTWAHELKCIDARQELFAKKAINDILFEARCGTLHRNSVQINCDTLTPSSSRCSTPYTSFDHCQVQSESASSFMNNYQGGHFSQVATESRDNQSNVSQYFSSFDPNA